MTRIIPSTNGYYLLPHNARKSFFQSFKYSLIFSTLCISLFLLFVVYLVTVGIKYQVVYPDIMPEDFPFSWVRRAITYNRLDKAEFIEMKQSNIKTKLDFVDKFKLICYYQYNDDNRTNNLQLENIDAHLCTHINICFGQVVNNTVSLPKTRSNFVESVVALKNNNKNLKVLLSIGGSGDNNGFPEMVINHKNRKKFIHSVDKLIREYNLDGIDLDWEFPNQNTDHDKRQKIHFMQLLLEIRKNIEKQEKHKYLLSVAVAAPSFLIFNSYDIERVNEYVDYINLMSYDYHFFTRYTPYTGINAPLYKSSNTIGYFSTLNINYSSYYWHFGGMEKNKIMIGLPTYGHSFTLTNTRNNGIGAPAKGFGRLGFGGFTDYKQTCIFVNRNKINPIFDMETKSPYVFKNSEWISYDDTISLTFKTEYIKNNNFGGAMIFSLNMDDHIGICKNENPSGNFERFPLTNTVKKILNDNQM